MVIIIECCRTKNTVAETRIHQVPIQKLITYWLDVEWYCNLYYHIKCDNVEIYMD